MTVDVTWLGYFLAAVSLYYAVLFILSMRVFARRNPDRGRRPAMALIVPAHNEEAVIRDTLESLSRLDYDRYVERSRRPAVCSSSTVHRRWRVAVREPSSTRAIAC
jgi:hypothetical protein